MQVSKNRIESLDLSEFNNLRSLNSYDNSISGENATVFMNSLPMRDEADGAKAIVIDDRDARRRRKQ